MEPNNILDTFFSVQNPAIIVFVFFVILTAIVVMIKRDFITPLQKRIKELEKENDKLRDKFMTELKES